MNAAYEKYLNTVDKCLRPLPVSERVDIVKEIKSSILEMEGDGLSEEQILDRLGKPKELAKAYLGDLLAKNSGFSWSRVLTICAFYSLVGFSGVFVIPTLVILAPTFLACGIAMPIVGTAKLVDFLLGLNLPFMKTVGIWIGRHSLGAVPVFFVCIASGVIFYVLGRVCWKLLVLYCKKVGRAQKVLL